MILTFKTVMAALDFTGTFLSVHLHRSSCQVAKGVRLRITIPTRRCQI